MRYTVFFVLVVMFFPINVFSAGEEAEDMPLDSAINRLSYATGYQIGDSYKRLTLPLIPDLVLKGMNDARTSATPLLTKGEVRAILSDPKKFLLDYDQKNEENARIVGEEFLKSNLKNEGVVQTDSGLQYKIIENGSGSRPKENDRVRLTYQGRKVDGSVFDKKNKTEPVVWTVNQVVPGLTEGLQLMQEGATWEFYLPAKLAFRDKGPLAQHALIYTIRLAEVLPAE